MRIGILTFHRSINNGAFMQAYALSNQIRERFGDIVEIIDFEMEKKHEVYKAYMYGFKNYILYGGKYGKKYENFRKDLGLLSLSPDTLITNDYDKVLGYIEKRYDIIIVGSDAVWAYNKYLGLKNPYWLFGDKLDCIKMSYAASAYSLDVKNVPLQDKEYIADCLKSFSYIGVRDSETYNFIKSVNPSLKIETNCDPTVLLKKPDKNYAESLLKSKGINTEKKIVSIMLGNNKYMHSIKKIFNKMEYELVDIHMRNYSTSKYYLSTNKSLFDLSPYEWYHTYSCSFLSFTNFFHGTLLALKSNVPTFSFDSTELNYNYMSKIKQLLTDMDLLDFWIDNTNYSKEQEDRILSQVEYAIKNQEVIRSLIETNMEKEQKKSDSFFDHLSTLIHR